MKTLIHSQSSFKKSILILIIICSKFLAAAQEVAINDRSFLVMNGNVSLVVNNAALRNNGNFSAGTGTVKFTGNQDTTNSYLTGQNGIVFYNLTVDNSSAVVLKSTAAVQNTLTVNNGTLYTDSNLTLKSNNVLTARVAPIPAGAAVNGKVKVERFIPARRAWRILTSPLTNTGTIFKNWQNSGIYQAGINTFVTGPNPGSANGLDVSPQNNVSMKTWDATSQAFSNVSNTKVNLSAGLSGSADNTAYFMFVRGDRNTQNFSTTTCNFTTLSSVGNLQTGTQKFTASNKAGGYTMIGNPYASPVDFSKVTRNNVINRFYVWDPTLNQLGGYVMLDDLSNSGTYVKTVNGSAQTKEIQSGQGFFVQTITDGPASITFTENSKSTNNNTAVFRPTGVNPKITLGLNLVNSDGTLTVADGTLAEFNSSFDNNVDIYDALKFTNTNENIAFVRNGSTLAAERRLFPVDTDTLYLKLWKTTARNYQFQINADDVNASQIILQDTYLKLDVPVSTSGANTYNFTVDGTAASADPSRFRIVFRNFSVLPVTFTSVTAVVKNSQVAVNWKTEAENNIAEYVVESSTDGSNFSKKGNVDAIINSTSNSYQWIDVSPAQNTNYYRIKAIEKDGTIRYSNIVKATITQAVVASMKIYPNPVTDNVINLQMINQQKGTYQITLTNAAGQALYTESKNNNSSSNTISVAPSMKLAAGIYQLEVVTPENTKTTLQVMVK